MRKLAIAAALGLAGLAGNTIARDGDHHGGAEFDYGVFEQRQLRSFSGVLFGVIGPVQVSSTESVDKATAQAHPESLITVAKSLRVRTVSAEANLGADIDMIAFWPNDRSPTHLIVCNEEGTDKPAVQRVRLVDGKAETILTGMQSCDPVRRTAWGTIIAAEEVGPSANTPGGWLLEIINPLDTTDVQFDRANGMVVGRNNPGNVAPRPALGRLAFEGIALYPNGVMYYGDENRP